MNKDINLVISDDYYESYNQEKDRWYYLPKSDLSGTNGHISIFKSPDELKYYDELIFFTSYFEEKGAFNIVSDHYINDYNHNVIRYVMEYDGCNLYIYYIFDNNKRVDVIEMMENIIIQIY